MKKDGNPQIQTLYGKILNDSLVIDGRLSLETFIPSRHHVVVKRLPADSISKGGIVYPEQFKEDKAYGFVVKLHQEDDGKPYQVGDLVLFPRHAGYPMPMANQDLVILQYVGEDDTQILGHWPKETFDPEALMSA